MSNLIEAFEKKQIKILTSKKRIPAFRAGDSIKVSVKIIEGERTRLQAFEGVCIGRKNNGLNSNFTIRKLSHGEGVERVFPLFSPVIDKIEVIRKGDVNRAKLYYLRDRTGKKTRISDRDRGEEADQYELINTPENETKNQEQQTEAIKEEINISENETVEKKIETVDSVKATKEVIAEDKNPIEEKSESTAKEAEKTKDESKK